MACDKVLRMVSSPRLNFQFLILELEHHLVPASQGQKVFREQSQEKD
jgi:hypothetical protein